MDDPLDQVFDYVILGTGLCECILSAALSRQHKKVLNLDSTGSFGSLWSSMSLQELAEWIRRHEAPRHRHWTSDDVVDLVGNIDEDLRLHAPILGHARTALRRSGCLVGSWGGASLTQAGLDLVKCARPEDPSAQEPPTSSNLREVSLVEPDESAPDWRVLAAAVDVDLGDHIPSTVRRRFSLDLRPAVFLSRGGTIEAIVGANCHHYMEFMTVQRSMLLEPTDKALPGQSAPVVIEAPVPCSKAEVFSNPVLTLAEKRAITRFLVHCVELIAEADGMSAQEMNDTTLAAGRSLHRPQNKRALDPVFDLDEHERNMPFIQYLKRCGIAGRLLRMILFAVAELQTEQRTDQPHTQSRGEANSSESASGSCGSKPIYSESGDSGESSAVRQQSGHGSPVKGDSSCIDAAQGMARLLIYLRSVGRFSANAYVTALYGSGDTPQAFSRAASLAGSIFNVRCPVAALCLPPVTTTTAGPSEPTARVASVRAGEPVPIAVEGDLPDSSVGVLDTGGLLMCSRRIIASSGFLPWLYPDLCPASLVNEGSAPGGPQGIELRGRVCSRCTAVARIVVVTDHPLVSVDRPRAAIAVPPRSPGVNNLRTISAVQLDSTANVCPKGYCVFYASTEINSEVDLGTDRTVASVSETSCVGSRRQVLEQRALAAFESLRSLVKLLSRGEIDEAKVTDEGMDSKPKVLFQVCHAEVHPLAPQSGTVQAQLLDLVGAGKLDVCEADQFASPASFSSDWEADRAVRLFEKLCPLGYFMTDKQAKTGTPSIATLAPNASDCSPTTTTSDESVAAGGSGLIEATPPGGDSEPAADQAGETVQTGEAKEQPVDQPDSGPIESSQRDGADDIFDGLDDPGLDEFLE